MKLPVAVSLAFLLVTALPLFAAPLRKGQVRVEGMKVTVLPLGLTVTIDPLPALHHGCEGKLTLGQPGWRGDFLLPKTAWVFRALTPGSLVVALVAEPGVRLVEGRDYLIDRDWGSLNAAPGSAIPPGAKLRFTYDYTQSRLDLVERTPEGRLVVKKGQEDMDEPLLPEPTPGRRPLLSVYLPHNTAQLTMANINLIDPDYQGIPPVSGGEHLAQTREKLAVGDPVTIVFFGDSITDQQPGDFRDGKGSFVDRVAAYLAEEYESREAAECPAQEPERAVVVTPKEKVLEPACGQIVVVKAGVGGDDTRGGLARMDRDVLAHHPDLVVVMFGANDENRRIEGDRRTRQNNVPVSEYRANLRRIVGKAQEAGAEVILMTTSMKNRGWEGTAGNLDEYATAARQVAAEQRVCLVDNFRAWEDLPKRGYNYMVFLGSCINHPVDLGHQVFFEGVRAALRLVLRSGATSQSSTGSGEPERSRGAALEGS